MAAYTAFGEMVRPSGTIGYDPNAALPSRYQYAGGWGYESGVISLYGANPNLPPLTLQHVGARWYQPDIGRFVQRDPIGIRGGFNCYAYCAADPLYSVDPEGLAKTWTGWILGGVGAVGGAVVGGLAGEAIGGPVAGWAGGAAGCYILGSAGTSFGDWLATPSPPAPPPAPPDVPAGGFSGVHVVDGVQVFDENAFWE